MDRMQAAHIVERGSGQGTPYLKPASSAPSQVPSSKAPATRSKTIVLTDAGRAPWYNAAGQPLRPYLVGIAGGSASGKTSVAKAILKRLPNVPWVAIVSQDAFYKPLTPQESKLAFQEKYDFDHPDAFDYQLLKECIEDLRQAKAVEIPVYSFVQHQRTAETTYLYGPSVIIVEGIFVLHDAQIRNMLDLKIFVRADSDLMLARRIKRDILERGRSVTSVIDQYLRYVKPTFDNHVSITSKYADMIVSGANNEVAIDVISQHMIKQLQNRTRRIRLELSKTPATPMVELPSPFEKLGSDDESKASITLDSHQALARSDSLMGFSLALSGPKFVPGMSMSSALHPVVTHDGVASLPPNVLLLPQTPQLKSLLTILHDQTTATSEFTFACKRVGTLVVEQATSLLPYRKRVVPLHNGMEHVGTELDISSMCSVSILRSGSVLEPSLRRAFPAMSLGSLLIQSNEEDGEPHLYDVSLPSFIRRRPTAQQSWVFLLDAQIGTGAAAFMAIRVLLDHSVAEDHIIFLTLLASAKGGIHALHRAFPKVRIVIAGIDPGLEKLRIPIAHNSLQHESETSASSASHTVNHTDAVNHDLAVPNGLASPTLLSIDSTVASVSPDDDANHSSRQHHRKPSVIRSSSTSKSTRVVFAITPGCGSIGDRFWGTGAR